MGTDAAVVMGDVVTDEADVGGSPGAYQGFRPTICSQAIFVQTIVCQSSSTMPPVSPVKLHPL